MTLSCSPVDPVYDARRVAELLNIQFSAEELAGFGLPPPAIEGFVTFFDPGWSMLRLRNAIATKGTIFYPQSWYNSQDFATIEEQPRWRQLRMEAVKDSFSKPFPAQQTLIAKDEEIPLTRVVVTGMVIHFLATGQRLFPTSYVRCKDKDSDGVRVIVGGFDDGGLRVSNGWDDSGNPGVGVAASR